MAEVSAVLQHRQQILPKDFSFECRPGSSIAKIFVELVLSYHSAALPPYTTA